MVHRKLTAREVDMLHLVVPTTFRDIVNEVRKEMNMSRHGTKNTFRKF